VVASSRTSLHCSPVGRMCVIRRGGLDEVVSPRPRAHGGKGDCFVEDSSQFRRESSSRAMSASALRVAQVLGSRTLSAPAVGRHPAQSRRLLAVLRRYSCRMSFVFGAGIQAALAEDSAPGTREAAIRRRMTRWLRPRRTHRPDNYPRMMNSLIRARSRRNARTPCRSRSISTARGVPCCVFRNPFVDYGAWPARQKRAARHSGILIGCDLGGV
jgi:hypothetical protein